MADSTNAREQWQSRWGFLLAAVGSAVGLGNMWRFSYLAAENGGAGFVGLYLVFTALLGLPVMLAELTLGRGARLGPGRQAVPRDPRQRRKPRLRRQLVTRWRIHRRGLHG